MAQSLAAIQQLMGGFAPMATGLQNTTYSGMEGSPLMGQLGSFGMFASPAVRGMMGSAGYAPFGMHDVNVYDQMRDLQYSQAQMAAMANAARHDRENFFRTFRGVAAMSGTQFGAQQRRAAYGMADLAGYAAPMMAHMNPEMLESLGGLRGSATLMTQRMMMAGRYRADPVTGMIGMTPGSASNIANNVYSGLYGDDYRQMHGLTAGQAGDMFGELQNRGLIGQADGNVRARAMLAMSQMQRTDGGQLQRAFTTQNVKGVGDLNKLSGAEVDKMMLDPGVADRMRGMDAEKIKQSLKAYSGAVSAMRDIFGDMGRPNAPMRELMQGLEALTAGSSAWMSPSQTSSIVRQTYNLAKQTGISMDAAVAVQQHAASRADQMGMPAMFAIQAAQGGLAFGGAYRASGNAANGSWGMFNADQLMQADVNLRVQASGSHMANRLGAVARLAEARGGFAEGSDAANLMRAIKTGQSSFMSGKDMRSVVMDDQSLFRILGQAGVNENTARDFIDQAGSNRQYIDRFGIGNTIRREQGRAEINPFIRDQMHVAMVSSLTSNGMNSDEARAAVAAASGRVTDRMLAMDDATFKKTDSRTRALAKIMEDELNGTGAGRFLAGMDNDKRQAFLQTAASHAYGHTQNALGQSTYRGLGGLVNIKQLYDPALLAQSDAQQQQAAFSSQMQEAMSPLGHGSALARAMQFIQDTKPGDEKQLRSMLATALGGVKSADIQGTLLAPLQAVQKRKEQLLALQSSLASTTDPVEKNKILGQIDVAMRELNNEAGQLAKIGETYGYYGDSAISRADTQRGIETTRAVADSVQDLGSIRGGFGNRSSASEIKSLLGATGLSHAETAAVMLARRHADKGLNEVSPKDIAEFRAGMSHRGTFFSSDEHAKKALLAMRRENINILDPDEVEAARSSIKVENEEEARAVSVARRMSISPRASKEQIDAMRKQGIPESLAVWAADQEQRAKRFGISEDDITRSQKAYIAKYGSEPSRAQTIHGLVQDGMINQYNVSAEDIKELRNRPGFAGKSDKEITDLIVKERVTDKKQRFDKFFASPDAGRFREDVDSSGQFGENLAAKLVTPNMVNRFGTQALEWNKELRAIQQRQRELAYLHTGGDMARLEAGNLTGLDLLTPEGRKKELEVIGETDKLRQRQIDIFQTVDSTHGGEGRQFRRGSAVEGYDRLMSDPKRFATSPEELAAVNKHKAWIEAGAISGDLHKFGYSKDEYEKYYLKARERAQDDVGDEQEARRLLGLPLSGTLDKDQAERMQRAKYTVSLMRRLKPDDVANLKLYQDADSAITNAAQRHGVSRDELIASTKGTAVARLTVAKEAEMATHNQANVAYRQAFNRSTSANERMQRLEAQLKGLPANSPIRESLEKQLLATQKEVELASTDMKGALASVKGSADARGVSAESYLIDRVGLVSESEQANIVSTVKNFEDYKLKADTIASSAGAKSAGDLTAYSELNAEYEKRQKAAASEDSKSGMDILASLNKAYGIGFDPQVMGGDSRAQKAAGLLGSSHGRGLISGLAASQMFLRKFATEQSKLLTLQNDSWFHDAGSKEDQERRAAVAQRLGGADNAGVDAMLEAYRTAGEKKGDERDKALAGFRKDFGISSDSEFSTFSKAADMQLHSKFNKLGAGRSYGTDDVFKLIDNVQRGGEEAQGAQGTGRTEISGTLRIIGNTGEINATTGGSILSVPIGQ